MSSRLCRTRRTRTSSRSATTALRPCCPTAGGRIRPSPMMSTGVRHHGPPAVEEREQLCGKRLDRVNDGVALDCSGAGQECFGSRGPIRHDKPRAGRSAPEQRPPTRVVALGKTHVRIQLGHAPEQVFVDADRRGTQSAGRTLEAGFAARRGEGTPANGEEAGFFGDAVGSTVVGTDLDSSGCHGQSASSRRATADR